MIKEVYAVIEGDELLSVDVNPVRGLHSQQSFLKQGKDADAKGGVFVTYEKLEQLQRDAFEAAWNERSDWSDPHYTHPGADDFERAFNDYLSSKSKEGAE